MKRIEYYIFSLLILVSLTGCAETNSLQESNTNSVAISEFTTAPEITPSVEVSDVTTAPEITSSVKAEVITSPEITPTTTPQTFNVEDVKMQSTPGSSCFSEIGYDSDWEILVVKFRDSGSVYTYLNFPMGEWNKFISADSLGSWYNKHIKNKYECERIN